MTRPAHVRGSPMGHGIGMRQSLGREEGEPAWRETERNKAYIHMLGG